jgi:hypothetical protein
MTHIENVIIGKSLCSPQDLLASSEKDWEENEKEKTLFTDERFLPKILVSLGIFPSISEIRRNKPELCITLDKVDFLDKFKITKKVFLWIVIGE